MIVYIWFLYACQGRIQDFFLREGLNIEVISEAGGLGHSPPEATGCFSNITPKL